MSRRAPISVFALALALCSGHPSAFADERPVVAVFGIQDARPLGSRASPAELTALTDYLAAKISASGAFQRVPEADLRAALHEKTKESYAACYEASCQIEIGKEVSASKTLATKISRLGKTCYVEATLWDLRTATSEQTADAEGACDVDSIRTALKRIAEQLAANRAKPVASADAPVRRDAGEPAVEWDPTSGAGAEIVVSFASTPPGASVRVDGKLLCQSSVDGCTRQVRAGRHQVTMEKERYLARTEAVELTKGAKVEWALEPDFGVLHLTSTPSGAEVTVDGQSAGRTPLEALELAAGPHEVQVADPCHVIATRSVKIARGEKASVDVALVPREGAIDVSAEDAKGNAVEAEVRVDGARVGTTPAVIKVGVCAKKIEVRSERAGRWWSALSIEERKTVKVKAVLAPPVRPRLDVVSVPAGEMWMGCAPGEPCGDDEKPRHRVYLDAFEIDRTEVTQGAYAACVDAGECRAPNYDWDPRERAAYPVTYVFWDDAVTYCKWAGMRLPTEAEWEKAARGPDGRIYPWGNAAPTCARANLKECGGWIKPAGEANRASGASPYGALDMAGNVWEWVADAYDRNYYAAAPARNPTGPSGENLRVGRGGGFRNLAADVRAGGRNSFYFGHAYDYLGFRCARSGP